MVALSIEHLTHGRVGVEGTHPEEQAQPGHRPEARLLGRTLIQPHDEQEPEHRLAGGGGPGLLDHLSGLTVGRLAGASCGGSHHLIEGVGMSGPENSEAV